MFTMPRRGIVNVKMVITEEKILSNIDKIKKLINPSGKKQIIELEDDSYFKEMVESIKTYLIEYPNKKNFPKSIYDEAYGLVEYATTLFEENTKEIEKLIKQREFNIKTAAILKQTLAIVQSGDKDWRQSVADVSDRLPADVIQALNIVGTATDTEDPEYKASLKLINAKAVNLESNLHIEIDMERIEDKSKALSYIGIEIADALKLIPTPMEDANTVAVAKPATNQAKAQVQQQQPSNAVVVNTAEQQNPNAPYQNYYAETRREVKESLWHRFMNSKFMHSKVIRAIKYAFRIRISFQLPEGLPDGQNGNQNNNNDNNQF